MKNTTQQMTDAVFASPDALDAVFGSFDWLIANLTESTMEVSRELRATRADPSSRVAMQRRENKKRRVPWLGL